MSIHLGAEFDKEGSAEFAGGARPGTKIFVEISLDDGRHRKCALSLARLVVLRSQHQANIGYRAVRPDPLRCFRGKCPAFVPVVREVDPSDPPADGGLVADHILQGDVVFFSVDTARIDTAVELSRWRRQQDFAVRPAERAGADETCDRDRQFSRNFSQERWDSVAPARA